MSTFKVKAQVTLTYVYDVEADTIEDAIALVQDGDAEDDCTETDSSMPYPIEYAIEGQMGWNDIYDVSSCEDCGNHLNDGSDVCDQCGGKFA